MYKLNSFNQDYFNFISHKFKNWFALTESVF